MALIKADSIGFYYEDQAENLLFDLNFEINRSAAVGLIGRNGCGKSTLIRLITGQLQPQKGIIHIEPGLISAVLPQQIEISEELIGQDFLWQIEPELFMLKKKLENPEALAQEELLQVMAEFDLKNGYSFDLDFEKIISQFAMDKAFLQRKVSTLSGGEKTKLALARIMLTKPDLLLLDEPTNHLDVATLTWLEEYLNQLTVPFLVISHDRKFLDNCVKQIWEMDNKKISEYFGNYSFYKMEKEREFQYKLHQYESSRKRIKKLKKAVSDRKNWAKSHQAQTGSEGYAPVYETIINPAKDAMRRAKAVETRLNREIEKAEEEKPWIEKSREIHFQETELRIRTLLKVENISKSFGDQSVLEDINFALKNGTRLLISGRNGSGKSTLMKILAGKISDFDGNCNWSPQVKLGYYDQELEILDPENEILDELTGGDVTKQSYVRTVLGSLNLRKDMVYKKIGDLSIGEKSKVALTSIITSDANVLLLDEPTNHLEIDAREALEEALLDYTGTIVFISHDRYFCERLKTEEIKLDR